MFKHLRLLVAIAVAFAAQLPVAAGAETYQLHIENQTGKAVEVRTVSAECMKRTPSAEIPTGARVQLPIETETKDGGCWQIHRASELELQFSTNEGWKNRVRLSKRALLSWMPSIVLRRGLRARVTGSHSSVTIKLTHY